MNNALPTRILIRATTLETRVLSFADELAEASGHPISFVVDERKGKVIASERSIAGLTDEKCRRLGLYCPADYAWRCGDYGYYIARHQFPEAQFLWMIEYDVRFSGHRLSEFFQFFDAQSTVDFLATGFEAATWDWYWALSCRARDVQPYRCLFPVTRLSAPAIDALKAKRVAHSRRPFRRAVWPNDEAHVATTLANAGFACRDFNSFGRQYYDPKLFTFINPIDGDKFDDRTEETRMYHPVLYGSQYIDKLAKLQRIEIPPTAREEFVRRVAAKINSLSFW